MVPVAQSGLQSFHHTWPLPLAPVDVQVDHASPWTPIPASAHATMIEGGSTWSDWGGAWVQSASTPGLDGCPFPGVVGVVDTATVL